MNETIVWAGLELRVTPIAGVGVALRCVRPGADPLALPLLGRQIWELCCRRPRTIEGIDEVTASDVELLLQTRDRAFDVLLRRIGAALITFTPRRPQRFSLPVCFEFGEDWDFVCAHTSRTREEVIERLLASVFVLGMYGFLPGFAYLRGLSTELACPRRASPRPRVPSGSVALGGEYLGVYGPPSPGGWQLIGRTPSTIFSLADFPPLDLDVGDELVLERIGPEDFDARSGRRLRDERLHTEEN